MIRFVSLNSLSKKLRKLGQSLKSAVLCDAINDANMLNCVGVLSTK